MPASARATALLTSARTPRPAREPAPATTWSEGDLVPSPSGPPPSAEREGGARPVMVADEGPRRGPTRAAAPEVRDDREVPSRRLVRASDGVLHLPSTLSGARVSASWAAVVGAAAVVLVCVIAVGYSLFRGGTGEEPVATRPTPAATGSTETGGAATFTAPAGHSPGGETVPGTTAATAQPAAAATTAPGPGAATLVVHVVGEVRRPGVVDVPAGARVQEAIGKAGGPTRKAVLAGLNLARPVVDGEQILVPDSMDAPIPVNTLPPPSPAGPGQPGGTAPVDLNTADQATLEQLDGVGPVLAQRIIEWRTTHGRFTSVDELGEVQGVGDKKLEAIRPHVRV